MEESQKPVRIFQVRDGIGSEQSVVAAEMERNEWILGILEVRPVGLPDGLDVESEEKGGVKDDCQIL